MKNVIKIGFFALSFGLFAVACGGGKSEGGDSTAVSSTPIDSATQQVAPPADSLAKVDTTAKPADTTAAHH
ncbi:hypothetical protein [Chitinophaga silvatica]|nr:hypothetical protein [Chitinophaga silvatica]